MKFHTHLSHPYLKGAFIATCSIAGVIAAWTFYCNQKKMMRDSEEESEEELTFEAKQRCTGLQGSDGMANAKNDEELEDEEIMHEIEKEEEEKRRKARDKRKAKRNQRKEKRAAEIFQGYISPDSESLPLSTPSQPQSSSPICSASAQAKTPVLPSSISPSLVLSPTPVLPAYAIPTPPPEGVKDMKDKGPLEHEELVDSGSTGASTFEKLGFNALPSYLYSMEFDAQPIPQTPKVQLIPKSSQEGESSSVKLVMWRHFLHIELRKLSKIHGVDFPFTECFAENVGIGTEADSDSESRSESEESVEEDNADSAKPKNPNQTLDEDIRLLSAALCKQWKDKEDSERIEPMYKRTVTLEWLRDPAKTQWLFILCHGGYFATAIFVQGKPTLHTTCHKYISRRKQGGRQSSHDNRGGSMTSAGALIRRQQEAKWREQIASILTSWKDSIHKCYAIFIHAPGPQNSSMIHFPNGPISKHDDRIFSVPFTTGRPSFNEIVRTVAVLSEITCIKV